MLDEALAEIRRTVDGGETVALRGFGTFRISERSARKGRNPQTGEEIDIPASRNLAFKVSKWSWPLDTGRLAHHVRGQQGKLKCTGG